MSSKSLEWKTSLMDMIDSVGVNHRVGRIRIHFFNDTQINSELIGRMNREWINLYHIWIEDRTSKMNVEIHKKLKEIV